MSKKTSRILSAIMFQVTNRPSIEVIGVDRYRQLLETSARVFKPDPAIKIEPCKICGINAEWHTPANYTEQHTILYVHGGGYIAGSVNSHRDLASRIAKAANSRLLVFNYHLAPEHPFPAGLDDVRKIYSWLLNSNTDSHRISIAGDSAGGGLALALVADLLQNKHPLPISITLLSPWIDLECKNPSFVLNKNKDFMLTQKTLNATARYYTDQDLSKPLISPINNLFKNMPPVLIQVGKNEVLLDDSKQLAKKIEQENGQVDLEIWDDMFHVWHYFAKYLSEGRDAIHRIGNFISTHACLPDKDNTDSNHTDS